MKRQPQRDNADDAGQLIELGWDSLPDLDYRFSLANERTYLAWIRTALALIAGGIAVAKALSFHHESVRWLIAGPPIVAGGSLAVDAVRRWRVYEHRMRSGQTLPVGRRLKLVAISLSAYAVFAMVALALDR